jgi:hypothetical protein
MARRKLTIEKTQKLLQILFQSIKSFPREGLERFPTVTAILGIMQDSFS